MPILLELGARAARGDVPSQLLAAGVLRTLAEAAGVLWTTPSGRAPGHPNGLCHRPPVGRGAGLGPREKS